MTAPLRPDIAGVPIAWGETPFAAFGGRLHRIDRPSGLTVAEIVASIPDLPAGFCEHGTVCINGETVPRSKWARVRPKTPSVILPVTVTLHMPVQGPRARSIAALVATVALVAASLFVTGGGAAPFIGALFGTGIGGLFGAGTLGASLLSAGIGLAGSLVIAALTPPPVQGPQGDQGVDESKGSASADGNVVAIGGPLPRVCGTFRIFPPPVCEPVVEIVGEDEIVTQVYALAGPHAWSDVRLADADIESADDISVETREGWLSDPPLTLITRQAKVQVLQAEITGHIYDPEDNDAQYSDGAPVWRLKDQATPDIDLPTWTPAVSRNAPDEIWLHIYLPQGMAQLADLSQPVGLPIRTRIRRRGDTNWINLPEVHLREHKTSQIRKAIKIIWGDAPTPPTPPSDRGFNYAFKATPQQTRSPTSTAPQGWSAHSHFSAGVGSDVMSPSGAGNVQNVALYTDRAEFYLDPDVFPQGVYEVEVRRGTIYNDGWSGTSFTAASYTYNTGLFSGVFDFFYYQDDLGGSGVLRAPSPGLAAPKQVILARVISIWNESPVSKPGNALLCVQAQNRSLGQVSALASGYVRDWNGETWSTWTTTSNPAPHVRDVLAGDLTSRPVPSVNDDQLVEWRDRCEGNGFTFDGIMDGRAMGEALNLLCGAGYARPRKSERWGVIIDQDRSSQTPAQIFNPRNLANFRMEKAFADLPDGLVVTYRSRELDYQATQVVVYRNGYEAGNARRLEAVDLVGPVTETAAVAFAEFMLKTAEVRNTFYSGDADIEAIVTEAGDLVGVQHDVIDHYAGFAYIKEVVKSGGNVTGFVLDSAIPLTFPDDIFAVDEFFGLNNVFGCVRGLDFFELADVFTTTDVFADGTAGAGLAIRCKDGTVITKEITAESAEDDEVSVVTPFADPGTSVLDAGCLASAGSLGREYYRLIVRDVRPGRDVTAAVTFIDEAPELWRAAA